MRSWGGGSGGAGVGVESLVRVRRWANKKAGRRRENARCTEKNHTKCIFHKSLFPCPTQAAQHETSLNVRPQTTTVFKDAFLGPKKKCNNNCVSSDL